MNLSLATKLVARSPITIIGLSWSNLGHIMLRDLLTQIAWNKKWLLILDTPEHVDSKNIKWIIGCGSFLYQLFSKRDFYFIKCG
jgi:hypothetical protein